MYDVVKDIVVALINNKQVNSVEEVKNAIHEITQELVNCKTITVDNK